MLRYDVALSLNVFIVSRTVNAANSYRYRCNQDPSPLLIVIALMLKTSVIETVIIAFEEIYFKIEQSFLLLAKEIYLKLWKFFLPMCGTKNLVAAIIRGEEGVKATRCSVTAITLRYI